MTANRVVEQEAAEETEREIEMSLKMKRITHAEARRSQQRWTADFCRTIPS
jgi:hypothetical protein